MRLFGALLVASLVLSNYIGTIDMNNKYRYSLDLDTYVDRDTETDNEGVTSAIMGKKTNVVAPEESDYSRFRKDFATKIKNAYSDYEEFAKLFATNYVPIDRDEVNSHVDKLMPTKDEVSSVGHTPEELVDIKNQVESVIELDEEPTGIMTKPKPRPDSVTIPNYMNDSSVFRKNLKKLEAESYSTIFGDGEKSGPFQGTDVTSMTMDEVFDFTKKNGEFHTHNINNLKKDSTAIGKFQMIGTTLRDLRDRGILAKLNIDDDTIFNSVTQDKIAAHLAERRVIGKNDQQARKGLKDEWQGFNKLDDTTLDKIIAEIRG